MTAYSSILEKEPFSAVQSKKGKLLLTEIKKSVLHHYKNCPEFKALLDNRDFNVQKDFNLEDFPYFPASIFKKFDLLSVPKGQIVKTLYSSSTSGQPSKIMIDKITSDNQVLALNKIMMNFLGKQRRHFIIFDTEETIESSQGELSSRGTAIRGMLSLARKISFVLDKDLNLNAEKLKVALFGKEENEKVCFFGFSWLFYNVYLKNKENKEVFNFFKKTSSRDNIILHIGGWKKLRDINVSKEDFNNNLEEMFFIDKGKITDVYGMTEQLGTVYPDCEYGYKHMPLYSEIIIRDTNTLKPLPPRQVGFIQFLSPLPHSYPGISVLSDDLGKIIGIDDCKCGRRGKYFVFEKRSEKAEMKGCGDALNI